MVTSVSVFHNVQALHWGCAPATADAEILAVLSTGCCGADAGRVGIHEVDGHGGAIADDYRSGRFNGGHAGERRLRHDVEHAVVRDVVFALNTQEESLL